MHSIRHYASQFQGFNRNVRLFFISSILRQVGFGAYMVLYNLYIQELGYPPTMNGNIISWNSLAMAISIVPAGILSDRWGRKKVMVTGLFFTIISLVIGSAAQSSTWLLVAFCLIGFFSAFIQAAGLPFLAENSESDQRIQLFSLYSAFTTLAPMIGQLGSGFGSDLLHYTFHFSNLISLRTTLLIGTSIVAFSFLPVLLLREQKRTTSPSSSTSTSTHSPSKPSMIQRSADFLHSLRYDHKEQTSFLLKRLLLDLSIGTGAGLVVPYLNLYFHDRFHTSHSLIGIIISSAGVVTAFAMMASPWMVKRWGQSKAIVIAQLSSIPFLLITGLTSYFTLAFVAFLIRQALMNTANPIISTMLMERMSDRFKGLANSAGQMMFSIGWAITGPFSTQLVTTYGSYWGYAFNFMITAGIYLSASLFFYFSTREEKQSPLAVEQAS